METPDFLKVAADAPLHEAFCVGGWPCEIHTNRGRVLAAARECFPSVCHPTGLQSLHMTLWVDEGSHVKERRLTPYVRGLDELVFAGFDEANSALVNLGQLSICGRFSSDVGDNPAAWKNTIFPVLLSILGGSLGIVELHGACVARNNKGLLLIGGGRSGKSTLSMALAMSGFSFLSDDRTYCSLHEGTLWAWAVPAQAKLRRESVGFFEVLQEQGAADNDTDFRFDPEEKLKLKHVGKCRPHCLVFLDRVEDQQFELSEVDAADAAALIEQDLMAEGAERVALQDRTIESLIVLPRARLVYGGHPREVAAQLSQAFERVGLTT